MEIWVYFDIFSPCGSILEQVFKNQNKIDFKVFFMKCICRRGFLRYVGKAPSVIKWKKIQFYESTILF